jgi:hypothetical protein
MLLGIIIFHANSQIQIRIDSLELSQISVTLPKGFSTSVFGSHLNTGPSAVFHLSIINQTDTFVPINYNEWIFGYFYLYQGKTENVDLFSMGYISWNEPFVRKLLIPKETYSFKLEKWILLDYHARKNKNDDDLDYTEKMLEIIPTIRVYAISPDRQIFFSDQPKKIMIKKKDTNEKGYNDVLNVRKFLKKLSLPKF